NPGYAAARNRILRNLHLRDLRFRSISLVERPHLAHTEPNLGEVQIQMQHRYSRFCTIAPIALVLVFGASSARAQTASGSMIGIVRDSSQAAIVGARVLATNVDTNLSKETKSADPTGEYRLLVLPPGKYRVTV